MSICWLLSVSKGNLRRAYTRDMAHTRDSHHISGALCRNYGGCPGLCTGPRASYAARLFPVLALLLAACAPAPAPVPKPPTDPTAEAWYDPVTAQLAAINREAETLLREGKSDPAAALITRGQLLSLRLLAAPRPTLAAMQAASDLDQLYATMLLTNKNYGWARLAFQKNVSRWKYWRPQTPGTARRLKSARDGIAECDRRLGQ